VRRGRSAVSHFAGLSAATCPILVLGGLVPPVWVCVSLPTGLCRSLLFMCQSPHRNKEKLAFRPFSSTGWSSRPLSVFRRGCRDVVTLLGLLSHTIFFPFFLFLLVTLDRVLLRSVSLLPLGFFAACSCGIFSSDVFPYPSRIFFLSF